MIFPTIPEAKRPYRIWDAAAKGHLPGRCYSHPWTAHRGVLIEIKYAKVGKTYEVYNTHNGKLLCQYTRRLGGIDMNGG